MAFEIKWTKRADQKFDLILHYLSTRWGDQTTKAFVKRVYDFLDLLTFYPGIGSIENEEKQIRGFPVTKQVIMFYRLSNTTVIILDFFDNRQSKSKKRF